MWKHAVRSSFPQHSILGGRQRPFLQNMSTQSEEKTLITTAPLGRHSGIITRHLLKFDITGAFGRRRSAAAAEMIVLSWSTPVLDDQHSELTPSVTHSRGSRGLFTVQPQGERSHIWRKGLPPFTALQRSQS